MATRWHSYLGPALAAAILSNVAHARSETERGASQGFSPRHQPLRPAERRS
jgi:hypothetical protein